MSAYIVHTGIKQSNSVLSENLFQSDFYEVKNWTFDIMGVSKTRQGYNDRFCLVIVKKGNFAFNLGRQPHDMHTGHIVIEKPGYEYRLRPAAGDCTIINFSTAFFSQLINDLTAEQASFFRSKNILSRLLKTSAAMEYIYFRITNALRAAARLEIDNLVLELLRLVLAAVTNTKLIETPDTCLKTNHLVTIERAKEYINTHFEKDISMEEISRHSYVSLFHFSRLFKQFTAVSPYQYLLQVRLKHSELLLKNSLLPVTDIALLSGFNSAENFSTAFKQQYQMTPTQFRK